MPPAPLPANEEERLRDLYSLTSMDDAGEELLNSFTRIASALFDAPASAISVIGADTQEFKSTLGLNLRELPRSQSPCAYTILSPNDVLVVPDMAADPRFADNPLVTQDPRLRFYAGAAILSDRGNAVGAICVVGNQPRQIPSGLEDRLRDLARGVSAAMTLRHATTTLKALAFKDPLTGVGNRKALEAIMQERGVGRGLLLLDLDRFKSINDIFGHAGGDRALVEVAQRIQSAARTIDDVVRLGGDEFAVVLRDVSSPEIGLKVAERIHAAFADTFILNGSVVPLQTSIGFAACPWHADTLPALLEQADAALYDAKRAGRGTTRIALARGSHPGRGTLEARLSEAFASGGPLPFRLVFQPIVELASGRITSAEALLRWTSDEDDAPSPSEFVPMVESIGQAVQLDRWVLEQACRLLAAAGGMPWPIALNVSGSSFGMRDLAQQVAVILQRHGVRAESLQFEMTETTLSHDSAQSYANIEGLKGIGVAVALDDFGGGHGTLARVRRYPFSAIKLDRSLVAGCDLDSRSAILLDAVANMASALGIPAVAEGVEAEGELVILRRLGVARAQGFLLSAPVEWDALPKAAELAGLKARRVLARPSCAAPP